MTWDWTYFWQHMRLRLLGGGIGAAAKILIGFVFLLGRAGLARLVQKYGAGRPGTPAA